jgi:hypothetical protein
MGKYEELVKIKAQKPADRISFRDVKGNFEWLSGGVGETSKRPGGHTQGPGRPRTGSNHHRPGRTAETGCIEELDSITHNSYDIPSAEHFDTSSGPNETYDEPSNRWDTIHAEVLDMFFETKAVRDGDRFQRQQIMREHVQDAVHTASCACPRCGNTSHSPACIKTQTVMWVGVTYRFPITVPVIICKECKESYTVSPLQVNCYPGSPGEGWDIRKAAGRESHIPIWFDLELVHFLEEASNEIRQFSIVKFAQLVDR